MIMKTKELLKDKNFFRNLVFGAEDSLVSTVGVLFGVATTTPDKAVILATGFIVVTVEALSMGAGSFLSETSSEELDGNNDTILSPTADAIVMFFSYFLAGFIPLAPYAFFEASIARYVSMVVGIIGLFALGYIPTRKLNSGLRMATIGGMAVMVGFIIGHLARTKLGLNGI